MNKNGEFKRLKLRESRINAIERDCMIELDACQEEKWPVLCAARHDGFAGPGKLLPR